jgi:hypothetical protein
VNISTTKIILDNQDILNFTNLPLCEGCLMGSNIYKIPFPKASQTTSNDVLELIYLDVCGPMQTTSLEDAKYFTLFINDFFQYSFVYHLKYKSH